MWGKAAHRIIGTCFMAMLFAMSGCGLSDEEVREISEAAAADAIASDVDAEFKRSQDFDQIAADAVAGSDLSDLDALTN